MVGGVADALRGSSESGSAPTVEGKPTQLGVLFSLTAALVFLSTGGPAWIATSLVAPPAAADPVARAINDLASGISLSLAIAAPLVAASAVVEVTFALIARAASPAQVHALLSPLRSLGLLAILALLFDRMAAMLASIQVR
jgi:type III secretory pathway component EscT